MPSKFTAQDFLSPEKFVTPADDLVCNTDRKVKQYQHGLETGKNALQISIGFTDAWGAHMKDGSLATAYEKLGWHSCTKELLQGFLDSGCEIVVHRYTDTGFTRTVIKEGVLTTRVA